MLAGVTQLMVAGKDQDRKWKQEFILSKWKNDLIIYFLDNTNSVKFIELNNFITEKDHWGNQADYLVPFGIRYYNMDRECNFLTSLLLKLLATQEWDRIKSFVSTQNQGIVKEYSEANIISEYDIIA